MTEETKAPEYQTIKAHKETYEYLRRVAFEQRQPMVTILQWWADMWRQSEEIGILYEGERPNEE